MKLFIGGLSWSTTEHELRLAFERFGDIREAGVVMDRESGRSRGFGFITFEASRSAIAAIESMNGSTLDGRTLIVNEARERARQPGFAARPRY